MITIKWPSSVLLILLLQGCNADISVQDEPTDPVVVEVPLAFIERPLQADDDTQFTVDLFDPARFNAGARLILKKNAFAQSAETDLTSQLFAEAALYDVKDLALSPDGTQLLFALRAPELPDVDDELQPKWDLWRYDVASGSVSPLIADPQLAQRGHDVSPAFLPDGRIIFSSTRQKTSRQILLDEFKPQYSALDEDLDGPAFNLHVMNADGTGIEQLTFNLSHDVYPVILDNGYILYSRWDNQSDRNMLNWYQMRPDGTENQLIYGWHSHNTGADEQPVQFGKAVVLADGSVSLALTNTDAPYYNSWPQQVAIELASDNEQPLYQQTLNLPAQTPLFPWAFDNTGRPERVGAVNSYYPLKDGSGRFLLSWSPCRVMLEAGPASCAQVEDLTEAELAAPLYGLWLFDTQKQTQLPVRLGSEDMLVSEPVVIQAYTRPAFLPQNPMLDPALAEQNAAVLDIRSVYDFSGEAIADIDRLADPMRTTAADRPARFLRLVRGVPIPPDDVLDVPGFAFGVSRRQLMRDILGFTAVQPDGSVRVKVPANVPLNLAVLNADGQAITPLHQQWITLRPGEVRSCNGCHTANDTRPHGRLDGEWPSANPGLTSGGIFPNTDPQLLAQPGETMAQTAARLNGLPELQEALSYLDIWTDPARRAPDEETQISLQALQTPLPAGVECYQQWRSNCRIRIDYPTHIQPMWQLDRRQFDPVSNELLADHTCVSCHSRQDADGVARVPVAQLELDDAPSDIEARHYRSYRELLSNDNEQELVEGVLVDRLVQATDENGNLLFLTDEDGNLILDENGDPIPVMVPVTVQPSARAGSALASNRFFDVFAAGGSHQGYLSAAELKLVADWLDIGAQYYNSPFVIEEP